MTTEKQQVEENEGLLLTIAKVIAGSTLEVCPECGANVATHSPGEIALKVLAKLAYTPKAAEQERNRILKLIEDCAIGWTGNAAVNWDHSKLARVIETLESGGEKP